MSAEARSVPGSHRAFPADFFLSPKPVPATEQDVGRRFSGHPLPPPVPQNKIKAIFQVQSSYLCVDTDSPATRCPLDSQKVCAEVWGVITEPPGH